MTHTAEPPIDTAALTRALREMHAAENSLRRATAEFRALLPPGHVLLHRRPDAADGPGTVYWIYWPDGSYSAGRRDTLREDEQTRAVIVAAPGPRDEFLPRLPERAT